MAQQFPVTISTTLTLLDQFQATLATPTTSAPQDAGADVDVNSNNALPLLANSAASLKAQVTKLSLLAITSPFTHSAVTTVLRACNETVLPSLVTAALLVTPAEYTKAFHSEVLVLVRTTLTEFATLVKSVKEIAGHKDAAKTADPKKKEEDLTQTAKNAVTVAVGRVWDACDEVCEVANKGVVGFVMRRVEQWRDLVKDAVEELEEWDPEGDDDFFDDLMGEEKDDVSDDEGDEDEENAALQEQKKSTLRFLKPVAQVYPVIVTNRLKNAGDLPLSAPGGVAKLESLMTHLHTVPEQVDEVVGALYESNWVKAAEHLKKTQKHATQAVNSVAAPWSVGGGAGDDSTGSSDKFTVWSKTWSKVMEEVSKSIDAVAGSD
ncbi:Uncharacterized protein PECH_006329 [Penicillium ucsense]|uniref:Cyclin-D1-binding protein 1-like N-terminal domain-containing protein n=1 Tax=Penicillium ucsense TaxID=2839758 RepID=A0A8J8WLH6_9EURO|nr:Uncharacterized protein PECM_001460 [Penicillium ucsense]KAF7739122.1 Uncharacterized protein PECH_006329 [Penicillium ucsense]